MPNIILENGNKIVYDELGTGKTVLFIHPPGMGRKVFYYQRKLGEHMRVIIPDLSGHGDSSRIRGHNITIEFYCNELISLLNKLTIDTFIICGYSAGGAIAQYISIHFSERVEGLILFGGYPAVLNAPLILEHKVGMYMVQNHKKRLATILAKSHTKDKWLRKQLIDHMNKAQIKAWYLYYKEVLNYNFIEDLNKITVPILLIYGAKSDVINHYHVYYKNVAKRIKIVFFKQTNHQTPTKQWKLANKEITKFITQFLPG